MYGGGNPNIGFLDDTYIYTSFANNSRKINRSNSTKAAIREGGTGGTWRQINKDDSCVPSGRQSLMLASLGNDGSVLMYGGLNIINNTYNIFNEAWVSTGSTEICCQPKSSDYKAQCATFIDATSCDDYSKRFGNFCAWKC